MRIKSNCLKLIALISFQMALASLAQAQDAGPGFVANAKVNLEDVKIKGESNGRGLGFSNRNRYNLDGRVNVRRDFRPEILENTPDFLATSKK